ncbi:hypothetical protein [Amphritea balenae]|nr:hypothetical protein [Amphritea balenae]GGK55198.1 hypothetical protein GCM10007941_01520 [Amphritea balenae]
MMEQQKTLNSSPVTEALGEIIWLMGHSELHRDWPIGGDSAMGIPRHYK